jgi:hypothetical protein
VGAFTLPDSPWKWGFILFFGLIGLVGFGLIINDWWRRDARPKFHLEITGVNIEHGFAENQLKSRYLVTGSIENEGGPSIAKNWTLMVEPPGKEKFKARLLLIYDDSVIGVSGGTRKLSAARSLANQTENNDVRGVINGYLWFETTPMTLQEANDAKTNLTLSVQDKFGKTHFVSIKLGDVRCQATR